MEYRPNPQPLPYKGRGVKFKASLLRGERNGSEVYLWFIYLKIAVTRQVGAIYELPLLV
jgi:hypothetical protein